MARKKVSGIESDVILTGGLVIGGYLLVKSFLPTFNVSDQDKNVLDSQQTTDPEENPFNNYYTPMLGYLDKVIPDLSAYDADTSDVAVFNAFVMFKHGNMSPDNPLYNTMAIYYGLYKALIGHLITGDQAAAMGYINQITSKAQCGFIAYLFKIVNGVEFWDVLRNGSFPMMYGLNGTDLSAATSRINNLPQ
jgi:hypothetical protein